MSVVTVISNREETDLLETFGVIDFEEIFEFAVDVGNHDTYRRSEVLAWVTAAAMNRA